MKNLGVHRSFLPQLVVKLALRITALLDSNKEN